MNVGEFFENESGQLTLEFYEGMEKTLWEGNVYRPFPSSKTLSFKTKLSAKPFL